MPKKSSFKKISKKGGNTPQTLEWDFSQGTENKKAIFKLLNGSEPVYDKNKWNQDRIRRTHNCYAYVLDIINPKFIKKPQPGYASGYSYLSDNDIRKCDKMFDRIKADNPSLIKSSFDKQCPNGYRKGYLAVDPGNKSGSTDYHFYRLDKDGYYSHKPGSTEVRKVDYDGRRILAPHKSKRESNSHFYDKSCGYFCFDPKKTNISNKPNIPNKPKF